MEIGRRYHVRNRRIRELLSEISESSRLDFNRFLEKGGSVEVAETSAGGEIIIMDGRAAFIQKEDVSYPTLLNERVLKALPSIVVDMGAVPYICNGADLMAPGVVELRGVFRSGDLVVISEERFSKRLAVAKSLYTSTEVSEKERGKIAINLHYIGDAFWEAFKNL